MRVTNSMISNNSQIHIGNAKTELMRREDQYTTQKKIQRPSDDPTVAIRSLQLRTTYAQLEQYSEKNIKDALDWMDTTESALKSINGILENMKGYLNQGANDPLDTKQRNSVLSVLQEYAKSVFEDNANADLSGRYMFTGYRTDTSLLFPEKTEHLEYEINEHFNTTSVDTIKVVTGGANYADGTSAAAYAAQIPVENATYRIQLAYDNCSDTKITGSTEAGDVTLTFSGGALATPEAVAATVLSSKDADAYAPTAGINYLYDTGELILSEVAYKRMQETGARLDVTYAKKEFEEGDIRPEMYFECKCYDTIKKPVKPLEYADPSDQKIRYEVNFSQLGVVNTQAKDAISTDIYRAIDYIANMVNQVDAVDRKLADVEKKITNSTDQTEIDNLTKLKEMLGQEKKLREGAMQQSFSKGLTMVDRTQDILNVAIADLGSRYNRFELTDDKLGDQLIDTEKKLSNNEDVDIADAYINLTQADNLYQASLSATAKILGNSLLNYI